MIAIWNHRELRATFEVGEQVSIRDVLGQNGIDYSVKAVGRNGGLAMGNARAH